jgi:hypothetical protein
MLLLLLAAGVIINIAVAWGCLTFERASTAPWPNDFFGVTRISSERVLSGLPVRSVEWVDGRLATSIRPIWPGFAINTVFYAFILWLLLAAPFALRRRRRIRRGLCPACAYPVGDSPVCTECGKTLHNPSDLNVSRQ